MSVYQPLLDEMIEDFADITRRLEQFADRWSKYGEQLADQLDPEQRDRFYAEIDKFMKRIEAASND